jgi:hypothetical protein
MQWPRWIRKRLCSRTGELDDPYATAGPDRDCSPVAPPPDTPQPLLEERDTEPSEISSARRWVYAMRVARRSMKLLWQIWIMLPPELRDMLIDSVER